MRFGFLQSFHANGEENDGYGMGLHGHMAASIAENGCLCFGFFLLLFC